MKRLLILLFIAGIIPFSCTKDIHLNLQSAAGLIVIEGNINNQPGPYTVYLSQTVTYYDTNAVVPVSGGKIKISDNAGNTDSLIMVSPGTYQTTFIVGTPGRTYHLSVNVNGKQYDAYSTMNPPKPIDSLGLLPSLFSHKLEPVAYVSAIPGVTNYYNARIYINGGKQSKADPDDNQFQMTEERITLRTDSDIAVPDTMQAELDVLDLPMYNYWYSLVNSTTSAAAVAPTNPATNLSNNALGYFSAYSSTRSNIIVADSSALGYHTIP